MYSIINDNNTDFKSYEYKEKKIVSDSPRSIPAELLMIIYGQTKNSVCKIIFNNGTGTGFFCQIPFPDKSHQIPVLITNYHILKEDDIYEGKAIKFSLDNDKYNYEIKINNSRNIYFSNKEEFDITIIEIKEEDGLNINLFLDIDYNIFEENPNEYYKNKSIYLLHYPHGNNIEFSIGLIKNISFGDYDLEHNCQTQPGSSGGPIINYANNKVVGIHKGVKDENNYNVGTFLKYPIKDFYEKVGDKKVNQEKKDYKSNNIDNSINNIINNIDNHRDSKNNKNIKEFEKSKNNKSEIQNKEDNKDEITIIYSKLNTPKNFSFMNLLFKTSILSEEKISDNKLFGEKFVEKNGNNCKIIINEKEYKLSSYIDNAYNDKIDFLKIKLRGISKIRNMYGMFFGCLSLSSLPDIEKIDTSNVIDMGCLFSGCEALTYLPGISKWNTSNVEDMCFMFQYCLKLESLPDISKWDTSNVRDMSYMFGNCIKISRLPDISKWDTNEVTSMFSMFNGCESLTHLPDISKWDTSNVNDMRFMFCDCKKLESLPDISKWDTSKVTSMIKMFSGCSSLSHLPDISKWNVDNVKDFGGMFDFCKSSLNVPKKFWTFSLRIPDKLQNVFNFFKSKNN